MTPRDYLKEPYSRVLSPDESGGYNAEVLEFPGCFAQGETVEEAYRELEDAAESWIEVQQDRGKEIPPPFSNLDYSGNISLRLPRSIHKRAAILAERDNVSLNSFLTSAVASRIGAEDFAGSLANRFEFRVLCTATTIAQNFTVAASYATATIGPRFMNNSQAMALSLASDHGIVPLGVGPIGQASTKGTVLTGAR